METNSSKNYIHEVGKAKTNNTTDNKVTKYLHSNNKWLQASKIKNQE